MKNFMGVILALLLIFTSSCSSSVIEVKKDADSIKPAKVTISNFHTGATAEYPLLIHNSKIDNSTYSIEVGSPSYTDSGYLKAPVDLVRDWILITDNSPVLVSNSSQEVLISLVMPSTVDNSTFWQLTDSGSARLSQLMTLSYENARASIYNELLKKYPRESDIEASMVEEGITIKLLNEELSKYPEANLLTYLASKSSVSDVLLRKEISNYTQIQDFVSWSYVVKGDLLKDKWEFWIGVRNTSITGNLETEMASRWLVNMRS